MAEGISTQGGQRMSKSGSRGSRGIGEGGITEQVMNTARETIDNVTEKAGEYVERASDYFEGFEANPASFIRNHPIQSAIGGLVVGLLIGTAVSRRTLSS